MKMQAQKKDLRAQKSQQILKHQKHQDKRKENLVLVSLQHHRQIIEGMIRRLRNTQRVGKNKKLKEMMRRYEESYDVQIFHEKKGYLKPHEPSTL